ncbi:MAG: polysaccharide deacetylase family protein [Clostridiales Family XIII bacterium]|jgi:peptidoglycan/xylan/chitin deacetylase (PgdA/CDA1 family)|nr:polysaccharide deacetylase family protein [Clostridiales Family XIII bacterium]
MVQRTKQKQRNKQFAAAEQILLSIIVVVPILVAFYFGVPARSERQKDDALAALRHVSAVSGVLVAARAGSMMYRIDYNVSGEAGASVEPQSSLLRKGEGVEKLPVARKEGYRFTGWYLGAPDDEAAAFVDNSCLDLIPKTEPVVLYARFEPKPTGVDRSVRGLPVFMYHRFYDPAAGDKKFDGNDLYIQDFEDQLRYLTENDFYFPDWDEVESFVKGDMLLPEKSVVLTSDDGDESVFRLAIPLVEKYKVKMTFFMIGKDTSAEAIAPYRSEHVIFHSHTYGMHRQEAPVWEGVIRTMPAASIIADTERMYEMLGTKQVVCYPYGHTNDRVIGILQDEGVEMAFTTVYDRCYPMMNPLALPRIRIFDGNDLNWFIDSVS